VQRLRWGVLPQALPEIASFVLYRFEINIRASAVLGVIGAGGIGGVLAESLRFKDWGTAGLALIIVVVVTMMIDAVSGWVRRRLVRGSEQKVAAALLETPVVPDAAPAPASTRG
jgi:phosphonate transport system permease protein